MKLQCFSSRVSKPKKRLVTFSTAFYVESIILNFYYLIIFVIDHSFLKVSPPFIKLRRSRKSTNGKTTMPFDTFNVAKNMIRQDNDTTVPRMPSN